MQTIKKEVEVKGKIFQKERNRTEFPMLLRLGKFKDVMSQVNIEVTSFNQEFWPGEMLYIQEYEMKLESFQGVLCLKIASFKGNQEEWEYDFSLKVMDSDVDESQAQWILRIMMDMIMTTKNNGYSQAIQKVLLEKQLDKANTTVTLL